MHEPAPHACAWRRNERYVRHTAANEDVKMREIREGVNTPKGTRPTILIER
jgi:hypothetical protein